ncbi:septum formation initiator family protein [Corynebacterium silvaticum]|uniref:Septum formation initiator family protein n=1 Tax=Corynebacterium silvaticum TaxID=2320431 RepID=A0A7Y4LH01_9CORY|nr:septum formation initiator family protein [Corynebacterium silvaticum]ARU45858.1 septum formation initiator family protein [Corynebacterium silvaticum]MBH5300408.1 septum formation initiator family protein [Corynebacterium silvaticum]NOM64605.1 septum formation initiator family protein [Corynebacterium silvaticum]NON69909.1 septum formation initiator family protein [Corynebacterium silvaticum]TFA93251.1 septum formation initiator family protein [Corynebacterium silvaticum]
MVIKKKRVVPVVNRPERTRGFKLPRKRIRLHARGLIIVGIVVVILVVMIFRPLHTYMVQRADIARLTSSIEQKQQKKNDLLSELDKYKSDAYVREQARTRLGVIARGERAYRVLTPELESKEPMGGGEHTNHNDSRPWFEKLWDSVSIPETPAEETGEAHGPEMHLPIIPTEAPAPPAAP